MVDDICKDDACRVAILIRQRVDVASSFVMTMSRRHSTGIDAGRIHDESVMMNHSVIHNAVSTYHRSDVWASELSDLELRISAWAEVIALSHLVVNDRRQNAVLMRNNFVISNVTLEHRVDENY